MRLVGSSAGVTSVSEQILWACQDQMNPNYYLQVVRTSPYKGELRLSFKGNIFYTEQVRVNFDAQFGPDFYDLEGWAHRACQITQAHEVKTPQ